MDTATLNSPSRFTDAIMSALKTKAHAAIEAKRQDMIETKYDEETPEGDSE